MDSRKKNGNSGHVIEIMEFKKRVLVIAGILLACIVCDRITKAVAKQNLEPFETIRFLYDTIRLQYAENTGAFLGLGSNISEPVRYIVFTLLVGIFLACLLAYMLVSTQLTRLQVMAMSLVLGGGCGNLIDRIANEGRVFDFMNVGIGPLRTGIFNVADMSITYGVLWFLFLAIKNRHKTEHPQEK
jgi:signal peptidase II